MSVLIWRPLVILYNSGNFLNKSLAVSVLVTLILTTISLFLFFYYEKRIAKKRRSLVLSHHIVGFKFLEKKYELAESPFTIRPFSGTPNLAKMNKDPAMRAFENQGYFELLAKLKNGQIIFIDRNNKKSDLTKISLLLSRY
jgi:hypothetical protein